MPSSFASAINWTDLFSFLLRIVAILICLVIHEVSHGFAAYKLGDPTAKQSHRLSLNPIHHLDPFGLLMMVVVGFGWAKPVPVDPRYFKKPKSGMAITALAGPLSNFVLAFLAALLLNFIFGMTGVLPVSGNGIAMFVDFLYMLMSLSIGLGIFNLIPFPPLDGSKILAMFLPDRAYNFAMRYEQYGMILLMLVLWLGWLDVPLFAARRWMFDLFGTMTSFAQQFAMMLR
ncbi:MAG: site-2 protease family protein [Evtepia sp.]